MNHSEKNLHQDRDDGPWYKQFWAWFVLMPLLVVMVAWIPFMTIAVKDADDVVVDNYYKEGRMINMRVDEDRAAAALGLSGELFFDHQVGDVVLTLNTTDSSYVWPQQLQLYLDHPMEADNDRVIILTQVVDGRYQGELQSSLQNHWYLRLMPAGAEQGEQPADGAWRIVTEVNFSEGNRLIFGTGE